jgi:SAM-dependent methyltransferase
MGISREFARVYAGGEYPEFSRRMGEYLPAALKELGASPERVLDLACGEGTFAVIAAGQGCRVTGIDISYDMLRIARERARSAGVDIGLVHGDMRALPFFRQFELVTCWFDSLNYLLEAEDLARTFNAVAGALTTGGLFIFDMNTVHGLAVTWRENPCHLESDTDSTFEVHRQEYDFETSIATMHITGFIRSGDTWTRIDERHQERGYSQQETRRLLEKAGFHILASWGSLRDRSEPDTETPRVWYVAKKRGV